MGELNVLVIFEGMFREGDVVWEVLRTCVHVAEVLRTCVHVAEVLDTLVHPQQHLVQLDGHVEQNPHKPAKTITFKYNNFHLYIYRICTRRPSR
jgi:hypothetical protein